jgi:hypothetical protein
LVGQCAVMLHFAAGFAADPAGAQPQVQAVAQENG